MLYNKYIYDVIYKINICMMYMYKLHVCMNLCTYM